MLKSSLPSSSVGSALLFHAKLSTSPQASMVEHMHHEDEALFS